MINKINPEISLSQLQNRQKTPETDGGASFKDTLKKAVEEINELQLESKETTEAFLRGDVTDLHQVMIAAEKARVGLELMLEIRNKMVEAYQEVMRMQM